MTRKALIEREKKRLKMVDKYATTRKKLQDIIHNSSLSDEERFLARRNLQSLPRNASPVRMRNRCFITGRPRGCFRRFGIARNKLRELALRGDIPGMMKASW